MIKISLLLTLIFLTHAMKVQAESSDDLYQKVFGKTQESKKVIVDATLGEFLLGGVSVSFVGEKIQSISGPELNILLKDKIRENKKSYYALREAEIRPEELPFKVTYFPSELRLAIEIPAQDLQPKSANIYDELIPYYARKADEPAVFSFGTNYKLEETSVRKLDQKDSFSVQADSFMNIKSVAVENQMNYLSTRNTPWYRQNSKMTIDRPNRMQRYEMGDVSFPIIGYQQIHSMGGISFYRDFSLNPYRQSGPTSSFEYELQTRSLVRTYVNNVLIKTEYMSPGHYSVKDIPLNNGINKIIVEVTDDFGAKKVLVFNEAGSLDLLAEGMNRYSLAAGYPSMDTETEKKYDDKKGTFYTGFFQHGMTRHWSASGYIQGDKNFTLLGTNNILATSLGNVSFDAVGSKNKLHNGNALQATYQLNLFGAYWYDSHTFTTRLEYRSPWFNESGESLINRFDYLASSSYSVPLFEKFNIAVGGNYENPRIGDNAKYGFDASLTSKVFESSSLTFYYARSRDDAKLWSTQLYFFLNIAFGESSTFASAFYEKNSDTKRLTVINDNGKKLNNLKLSASVNENPTTRDGLLDLQYNTSLADLGVREEIINTKKVQTGSRTSFRFMSSFAFVHNGDESGFSISRPISNSFVIFKPNRDWKGQRFGVQTQGGDNETQTGLFGESLVSGLTPYQYRRLQLDPSYLQPGYVLGKESFVVYPRYRSGHLFAVGKSGLLVVRGIILDKDQRPQPLKVGYWSSSNGKVTPFFTGREGEFFIEGVEPAMGKLQLDDEQFEAREIDLKDGKAGLIDIGNVILPYKESRL